jgi:hypothetical protein
MLFRNFMGFRFQVVTIPTAICNINRSPSGDLNWIRCAPRRYGFGSGFKIADWDSNEMTAAAHNAKKNAGGGATALALFAGISTCSRRDSHWKRRHAKDFRALHCGSPRHRLTSYGPYRLERMN